MRAWSVFYVIVCDLVMNVVTGTLQKCRWGRPCWLQGYLVAWLRSGRRVPPGVAHRDAHFAGRFGDTPLFADVKDGTSDLRLRARQWANAHLNAFPERPNRAGEPDEPPGRP